MNQIIWKDEYNVNNETIDDQHKKLVGILNEIIDILNSGNVDDDLKKIVKELADYTSDHFSYEEEFMEGIGFPDLETHKNEHSRLTDEVFDTMTQLVSGQKMNLEDVYEFLHGWLINHILENDLKYRDYIK